MTGTNQVGPGLGKPRATNFLQTMPIRTGIMLIGINLFSMSRLDYTLNEFISRFILNSIVVLQESTSKQQCTYFYPDYYYSADDFIGIDTYKSSDCPNYKAFCQLE